MRPRRDPTVAGGRVRASSGGSPAVSRLYSPAGDVTHRGSFAHALMVLVSPKAVIVRSRTGGIVADDDSAGSGWFNAERTSSLAFSFASHAESILGEKLGASVREHASDPSVIGA